MPRRLCGERLTAEIGADYSGQRPNCNAALGDDQARFQPKTTDLAGLPEAR
jgi:hypothetical protein